MTLPPMLVGKVAAITGGLTGIGRAIAIEYLRHGAKVAISHLGGSGDDTALEGFHREAAQLAASSSGPDATPSEDKRFLTVAGDISHPETGKRFIAETVKAFGRLDISLQPALFDHTLSTNLSGAFFATQAAARQMALAQSPPGGSIIGISSISALVGGGLQTHYTPTKAGVTSLMQSCAVALGKYNIRCNALLPGTIRTQLNEDDLSDEKKRDYMEGRIPLGRLGRPRDLAGPAVFLACEELSGYVTGAQLLVDGGMFVNLQ